MINDKVGRMHPKRSLFLHTTVAEADIGGKRYEVWDVSSMAEMVVVSKQTGRIFGIEVKQLIELAIDAGIDDAEEE
jgi:hypothetical protein